MPQANSIMLNQSQSINLMVHFKFMKEIYSMYAIDPKITTASISKLITMISHKYLFCWRLLLGICFILSISQSHVYGQQNMENLLYIELKSGVIAIDMRPDLAPNHVARIKELVRQKFYDGVVFHRVIEGFMAQTGDPSGTGSGGSGQNLTAEFSDAPHLRGTVSMARAASPDSADSQFFICFQAAPWLDKQYTVWGQVIEGMNHVDSIKLGAPGSGSVKNPDTIIRAWIGADEISQTKPTKSKKASAKKASAKKASAKKASAKKASAKKASAKKASAKKASAKKASAKKSNAKSKNS